MTFTVHTGDCRIVLASLPESSVDTVITDPPYGLAFMGKEWDQQVPGPDYWREVYRVAKPGAMLLAFGGTRTWHRLAAAIEDAGFELRDCLMWLYGSGFPKSLAIDKAMDKRKDWSALEALQGKVRAARLALGISQSEAARRCGLIGADETLGGGGFMWFETGMRVPTREQWPALKAALALDNECDACFEEAERRVVGSRVTKNLAEHRPVSIAAEGAERNESKRIDITVPSTDAAKLWQGWGTALKPAWEPIILAMKPLDGTFAENAHRHGVAGMAIDAGRIGAALVESKADTGRWPSNVLLDEGSAAMLDQQSGETTSGSRAAGVCKGLGFHGADGDGGPAIEANSGGASRFFYVAKAARSERGIGNDHPTVKPVDLMRYLCRLTRTPTGGVVLDPFCGSGTTGIGAVCEGRDFIGIELDPHHADTARARIASADPVGKQDTIFA